MRYYSKKRSMITLAISLTVTLAILCVTIFFDASLAWFARNDTVEAGGISISARDGGGIGVGRFELFKRDGGEGSAQLVLTSTDQNKTVSMTEYDTVFSDRNVNTPLILRIFLNGMRSSIDGVTIVATYTEPEGQEYDVDQNLQNLTSNIVGIRCITIPELEGLDGAENASLIYQTAVERLAAADPLVPFAHVERVLEDDEVVYHNTGKDEKIELVLRGVTPNANGDLTLYLEIDYIPELIEAYVSQNEINIDAMTMESGKDLIPCKYDINSFAIYYYESEE